MESVIVKNKIRTFKDLDLNFTIHPVKKDINLLSDEQAIINAVKNIVLTNHYEKPFYPDYGSNVRRLLFDNFDVVTATALQNEIEQCLTNFEPRISIISVTVNPNYDNNAFNVIMEFTIKNISEPITINFMLQRLR
jgi:phage baseplate assembly protein W